MSIKKKEIKKKKGEFTAQKRANKRRAEIYSKINSACKEVEEKGLSIVEVDNRRFYLCSYELIMDAFYLHYFAFLRLNKFGLVFCEVCEKDAGYQRAILPKIGFLKLSHTAVEKKRAACVLKVEDIKTGEVLFFKPTDYAWNKFLNQNETE